jgi:thiol-disulfide isomerase/thioredoxin
MAGFIEVLERIIFPYKRYILIIVLFVIFVLVSWHAYVYFYKKPKETEATEDVPNAPRRYSETIIYLFWADWCGHCKKAKPEWVSFQEEMQNNSAIGKKVKCIDVDCSDENNAQSRQIMTQFGVNSYPTVIGVNNDGHVQFDSKITKSSLEQFASSIAN